MLNRFIVNKTNRYTEFQFHWYYYSTCLGQPFCPSSGVLSRKSALVHFMQLWPFATRSRFHPTPGSKRSQLPRVYQSRCTAKISWWWAERLPETCRVVIPVKLEFSAYVGFINKESVTMHSRMILKNKMLDNWWHFFLVTFSPIFQRTSPSVSLYAVINAGAILLVSQKYIRLTKFTYNSFRFNEWHTPWRLRK
jgi:hypothetical protein